MDNTSFESSSLLPVPAPGGLTATATAPPYNGWATYTAVKGGDSNSGEGLLFWTVISFSFGSDPNNWPADNSHQLDQSSLAELVDAENLPPASFAEIPSGAYRGAISSSLPGKNGSQEYVWWRKGTAAAVPWLSGSTIPIRFEHSPQQTNIAPVLPNGAVLLGEAGKVTAVSSYRVVEIAAEGSTVTLQGEPGESIQLMLAHASSGFAVTQRTVTIGAGGTSVVRMTA